MRKIVFTAVVVICFVLLFFTGCMQIVPAAASVQQAASAQSSVAFAEPSKATVQPTAAPTASAEPSQTPSESASVSANVSASASPTVSAAYKVAVKYDLEQEKNSQKSVDNGHSPWRTDAIATVQSFVSIQMSPGGQVVGDFPIKEEDLRVTQMNDSDAVVTVNNDKSPISNVYLKRLVRQEDGGIWTVVGYDPK